MKDSSFASLSQTDSGAAWYVGDGFCALADSERHLGHAIKEGDFWTAYDAVHPDPSYNGFLALGHFKSILGAIQAIERSVVGALESGPSPAAAQSKTFLM
jgi:hypothetical protein